MNNLFYLILLSCITLSCEPASRCYILNDSQKSVELKVSPSIIDFIQGPSKLVLISLNESNDDNYFKCQLNPNDTLNLWSNIGKEIDKHGFPYKVSLFWDNDSIIFGSKNEFLNLLELAEKNHFTKEYKVLVSRIISK
jgi:hypothetical protein